LTQDVSKKQKNDTKKGCWLKNTMAQKQSWHKNMLPKNFCTRIKQMTHPQSASA
jgi:hypothetical protein